MLRYLWRHGKLLTDSVSLLGDGGPVQGPFQGLMGGAGPRTIRADSRHHDIPV